MEAEFSDLLGKTLKGVSVVENDGYKNEIIFETTDGDVYRSYHYQNCCEYVIIDDIEGDLRDLIGVPILQAEDVCNTEDEFGDFKEDEYTESFTWTFYKLATIKGYVTIRWLGESNGYYSESVDFEKVENENNLN